MTLLTIKEAAAAMQVSTRHIQRLIEEADTTPKTARWKFGKELIDLTPATSKRRTIRISPTAVANTVIEPPARTRPITPQAFSQRKVNSRVMNGEWPQPAVFKCSKCEKQSTEYHHEDYSQWWSIEPLCRSCHVTRHWQLRKASAEEPAQPSQQ